MKKIKALLFAFVALFAFTLAVVKVSAVTIDETFTFELSEIVGVASGKTQDLEATSTANPERKKIMTVSCVTTASGNSTKWKTDGYLEVGSKVANFKLQFIFTTEADATVKIDIGTANEEITYNVYDGEATTTPANTGTMTIANSKHTVQSFELTGNGTHIIEFTKETATSSAVRIFSVTMETSYVSSETPEQLAEAAIDRIGDVTYSEDSRTLIAAATTALTGLNTDDVSNYATYTAAVTAFNNLAAEKKNAFTTAVEAIGAVTEDSSSAVNTALDALDQLLETEKEEVSASIAALRVAQSELFDALYDTFDKQLVASDLELSTFTEATQLGNSIFKAYNGVTIDSSKTIIKDETQFTKRIKLNATAKVSDLQYVLSFDARTKGTLKIACISASDSTDRTLNIYLGAEVVGSVAAAKTAGEVEVKEVKIEQSGLYYLGSENSGINILSLEFVPETDPVPSVVFNQSAGYNADGVELVRYVFIVENMSETLWLSRKSDIKVVLTNADGLEFDITEYFIVANRLTNKGEVYIAEVNGESYEFGIKENTFYWVAVVAVSNDGADLTNQYVGKEITATAYSRMDANSDWVEGFTTSYTVLGAQA